MKKVISGIMTLAILTTLAGCGTPDATEPATLPPLPTQTTDATDPVPETEQTAVTDPTERIKLNYPSGGSFGILKRDAVYNGGEMRIPLSLEEDGNDGYMGVLLFLDGQIQPYKTVDDDTYRYMHYFSAEEGSKNIDYEDDLIFMPVTGKQGQTLELHAINIRYPDFSYAKYYYAPFKFTDSCLPAGAKIQFGADPDSDETEGFPLRSGLSDIQVFQEDLKYEDIFDWTETQLEENIQDRFFVNGMIDTGPDCVYEITPESEIHLRYEVYGTPYVNFDLTFFVENEPLLVDESCTIPISIERGKKTVVEATLTLPDFDGDAPIYAILVPKNYFLNDHITSAMIEPSRTFMLLEGEDPGE